MSTAVLPGTTAGPGFLPAPARWTCDEFHRLWDSGALEGKWVILVDGEMLAVPAPSDLHDVVLDKTTEWAMRIFPWPQYWVRPQMGMVLGINTDPIPDLAVVVRPPDPVPPKPRTALLVVEVSDTSLGYDTGDKASLYAAAGIPDYWAIDVHGRQLHVFRNPQPDPARKYGSWYGSVAVLGPADTVAALAAPNSPVTVGDLLP